MKTSHFLVAAGILFAMTFIFSCSKDDEQYLYCVYPSEKVCVPGPVTECPYGGAPKDYCPADYFENNNTQSSPSIGGRSSSSRNNFNPNDNEVGGYFTRPFNVTDTPYAIELGGAIAANAGANIVALQVIANGNIVTLNPAVNLPASVVSLDGIMATGVCMGVTGTANFMFEITVTFSEGRSLTYSKTASINCGGPVDPAPLTSWIFTLSYAGQSYVDIDAKSTYSQAAAMAIIDDIDLVAFSGHAGTTAGKIYSTWDIDALDANNSAFFYPISAADAAMLRNAAYLSDIAPFLSKMESIIYGYEIEGGVDIAVGSAFLVETTRGDFYAVVITSTGTQAVTLKAISLQY